uniref:Methyltransferase domain-containing protein n=1 Tax=Ciona savignyi TaxID=51511 RepID=H2YJS4_CIOSA
MTEVIPDHKWRRPSTDASRKSLERVQNIIGDFDSDHTMKYYDYWSEHYEQDLVNLDYKVPDFMAESLFGILKPSDWTNKSFTALDIGAGTGQMAIALKNIQYEGLIDALDGNSLMLKKAEGKGLYRTLTRHLLTTDSPLPYESNKYDAVVCCCAMVPALIQPECLPDMARVVKPGGQLYFTTRATDGNNTFRARVDKQLNQMYESGLLRFKSEAVIPQYSWPVEEVGEDGQKHFIAAVAICLEKLRPSED